MKSDEDTPSAVDPGDILTRLDEAVDHASAAETACRRIETVVKAGFEDVAVRFTRATTSLADRIRELEKALGDRQRESDAQLAAAIRRARRGTAVMTFFALLASLAAVATVAFALTRFL